MAVPGVRPQASKASLPPPTNPAASPNAAARLKSATAPATPPPAPAPQAESKIAKNLNTDSFTPQRAVTGGVSVDPTTGTASTSVEASGTAGPVSGGVRIDANIDTEVQKDDQGYRTVTISADASVTAEGSLDLKAVSIGGSATTGGNVTYTARLSESDYQALKAGTLQPPDPFDASTIPDGASVQLDQSQFQGTALEAGFRHNALKIGLSNEVTETEGTSVRVERDGEKLQVTAGPTQSITNNASVSLGAGPASIEFGNTTTLTDQTFATAEFDLATEGGRQGFAAFSRTGALPDEEGAGVDNVLTVQSIGFESAQELSANLGPLSFDFGGPVNTGNVTISTHPDGSQDIVGKARYDDGPELTVTRSFDPSGTEDTDATRFSYNFDQINDETDRAVLYQAFGYSQAAAEREASQGDPQLTFSQDQLTALADRAREVLETNPQADQGLAGLLATAETPDQVARTLTVYLSGQSGYAYEFYRLALDPENPQNDLATLPGDASAAE